MSGIIAVNQLFVMGANHRSSSLALRDALFVDEAMAPAFLADLRQGGLTQAIALSTCDRVEVIAVHPDAEAAARSITAAFARRANLDRETLAGHMYRLSGVDAVRHCFSVAAALDSLVIGEPHVLGQVKDAHRLAQAAGLTGPDLDAILQAAYAAARRVRNETAIAEGPVSIAAVAVQLARDLHGDLGRVQGLLIGTGDMGGLIAENLRLAGLKRLVVTAPREAQAEATAKELEGHVVPFADLAAAVASADVVLSSMSGRQFVITADLARAAVRKRRQTPIFFIDAGIPGDIEPAVHKVDNAFLYDLNDLEQVALQSRVSREAAARAAWDIIAAEVTGFLRGRAERSAGPSIQALRLHFEEVRDQVMAEAGGDADRATSLLINRLLHAPSEVLREIAASGERGQVEWETTERAVRRLFRLDGGTDATKTREMSH
ncbi:MAG: glutamyl-tRNA reductase [Alphaproteobacteria bacterium]